MPIDFAQLGMQAGSGILSGGMGMLLGAYNDRRQLNQEEKLQALQIAGNKEMTDYQQQKQLEMWEKTGYGPQMKQLEAAGLNPGLLYGMKGGGGMSVGSGAPSVTGGHAPQGGKEIQEMMGMGIQMQLLKAQKDNLDANTKEILSRIPGHQAEPGLKGAQTEEATAGANLKKIQYNIAEKENSLKAYDLRMAGETLEKRIQGTTAEADKEIAEAKSQAVKANVDQATQQAQIDTIKAKWAQITIENALMAEQKHLVQAQTDVQKAELTKMANEIAQKWQSLRIDEQEMYVHRYAAKIGAAAIPAYLMTEVVKTIGGIMTVSGILKPGQQPRTVVEGFKPNK